MGQDMKRGYFSSSAVALVLAVLVVAARGTGTGLLRAPRKTLQTPRGGSGRTLPDPADFKKKTDVWPTPSESVSTSALPEEAPPTMSNSAEVDPGAAELEPCAVAVVATGVWRKEGVRKKFADLQEEIGCSIQLLAQKDEAEYAAKCAFGIVQTQKLAKKGTLTLFVEAGRGSTQFTVMDSSGNVIKNTNADGFPKDTAKTDYVKKNQALKNLISDPLIIKGKIELVVAFGSLWYIYEKNGALTDKAELPGVVKTKGKDFKLPGDDPFDLAKTFEDTPMLMIRNVVAEGSLRKITWGGGPGLSFVAPFVDLGSGKAALTEPKSGVQLDTVNFEVGIPDATPGDMHKVAEQLKQMIYKGQAREHATGRPLLLRAARDQTTSYMPDPKLSPELAAAAARKREENSAFDARLLRFFAKRLAQASYHDMKWPE